MKNNSKILMSLTLFLGLGLFSNDLFAMRGLSVESLNQQISTVSRDDLGNYDKSATYAFTFAKRAFVRGQNDDAIKIAGLNLFSTMIENLEKVTEDVAIVVDGNNKNLRNEIITKSWKLARNKLGITYINRLYKFRANNISANIDRRNAAIKTFDALKDNYENQ